MRVSPAAHSPEAGAYAGLQAPAFAGPAAGRRPRVLSEKQRKGVLGLAAERIAEEANKRGQRWLRRLDTIHASGCRTKRQRWEALAAMAEPMLARLDLATLALGWLDNNGAFRLNRQRGLAEDSGLSESCVSRTLSALEAAQYVRRKVRRIYHNGQRWITRVTIHLRPKFFMDLGLSHKLAEERTRKKAQRAKHLRGVKERQKKEAIQEMGDAAVRKQSILNRETRQKVEAERLEAERNRAISVTRQLDTSKLIEQISAEHPDKSPTEHIALLKRMLNKH
jgi:hypothetical protein